jgi:hypothetical protein
MAVDFFSEALENRRVRSMYEAKFMLPWAFSEEFAADKYMAQVQHNMWLASARMAALSIITGGGKWVEVAAAADHRTQGPAGIMRRSITANDRMQRDYSYECVEPVCRNFDLAWAKTRGIDLHARRGEERWIIEVKGSGSLDPMRVNYFLGVLGETLQRMDDPKAAYSIALPDLKQFRNLWKRLPILAKQRTKITALFVKGDGHVQQVDI